MSDSDHILRDGARRWRDELTDFVDEFRSSIPDRSQLTPLQHEHRRVTGGLLLQFFEFLEKSADAERFPRLEDHPLEDRLFLYISDVAGYWAAEELMDTDTPQAFRILKEEWRAFLEQPDTDEDEKFIHHYQFWSVWHTNIPDTWEGPELDPDWEHWVHEEGFALADRAGRGAQHLWRWDGEEFEIVEQELTSWNSSPPAGKS